MEDAEIIGLYFDRKEEAVPETAKKYGAYLNKIAHNILGNREDSEEVVCDTYLAAWNTIPPERPRVLRHYLSRITRNLSFDRLDYRLAGKRNSDMVTLLSELEDCIPDRDGDLEAILETRELGAAINAFLARLSREDCALFLQRYYYSLTVAELQERFGLTEGMVKYRLSTLRKKLRRSLEREGFSV